jgi:LPXTG-motif cell wall-anchored protein
MSLAAPVFAAATLAAAFTGMLSPPVSARQAAAPEVAVYLPDVLMAVDSGGTLVNAVAISTEPREFENFVLKLDLSGLDGVVTVSPDPLAGCDADDAVMTCELGTVQLDSVATLEPVLSVVPAGGAAAGATGKWKATISADELEPTSMESTVTLAEGVDLGVPRDTASVTGAPGSTLELPLEISNAGDKLADGAVALISAGDAIGGAKPYSNCTFRGTEILSCSFDEQLAVGGRYASNESPLRFRSDISSPASAEIEIVWVTKAEFAALKKLFADLGEPGFFGSPGNGGKLVLEQAPSALARTAQVDIDGTNNGMVVSAKAAGAAAPDVAAVGGTASGSAGQVVTLNLGLHNVGQTLDLHGDAGKAVAFDLTLPAGSSLGEMPAGCVAMTQIGSDPQQDPQPGNLASRIIRCGNGNSLFQSGTDWTVPIKLRIDQIATAATGTVRVASGCEGCYADRNAANDTADVVLNAALPKTGVQTGLLAGTGVLLALAGVVAFILGRRRRFKFNDETD